MNTYFYIISNLCEQIRAFNGWSKRCNLHGDHVGKAGCSYLEYLYPGSIKFERLEETEDWFVESAKEMSLELGEHYINTTVDEIVRTIKEGLSSL